MRPARGGHRQADRVDPPRRGARLGALLLWALTACGSGETGPGAPIASVLPALQEVPVADTVAMPGSVNSAIVAGPDGGWLFGPADLTSSALVAVRPDGRTVPLGGFGEGPGEMRRSFPLWLDDTIAIGVDYGSNRLIAWRPDGTVHHEVRLDTPVLPTGRGPAGTLLAGRFVGEQEVPVLIDPTTGAVRATVAATDSALSALFDEDDLSARVANSPAFGRWAGGIVIGNGLRYRLLLYDTEGRLQGELGRDLPPSFRSPAQIDAEIEALRAGGLGRAPERLAAAREALATEPVRRFPHTAPPRSDGHGRLWVVVLEGDAVFADLFDRERFLGRLPLDCPGYGGRWDLNGAWLLLVCGAGPEDGDLDAVVRRYRIVEPPGTAAVAAEGADHA